MVDNKTPLNIAFPPDFIFRNHSNRIAPAQAVIKEQAMYVFERMDYEKDGVKGQYAWFKDCPHPTKGHPYPQAIHAINAVKRATLHMMRSFASRDVLGLAIGFILTPKRNKLSLVNRAILGYCESAAMLMGPHLVSYDYCSPLPKELWKFIDTFFSTLGVSKDASSALAEIFSNLIQYDNAYYLRLADIFSETDKESILERPAKEIDRLLKVYADREPSYFNTAKFQAFAKVIKFAFWIPSIKKAFKKALEESEFKNFQLDEDDRYHVLLWSDYNFLGKTIEERIEIYKAFHEKNPPYPPRITMQPG